ncbi:MAG: S8 family serine peptidase [Verrucomicrobiota bacterium]|nr:S8 family serine peptidase [Verrucomicrobiota bacterium]
MRDALRTIPLFTAALFLPPESMPHAAEDGGSVAFALKTPRPVVYLVKRANLAKRWVDGCERDRPEVRVQFSSRVVLQLAKGMPLGLALRGCPLQPDRELGEGLFVLQAGSAAVALEASQHLAKRPGVRAAHPVRRRPMRKMEPLAKRPDDPLYPTQWPLEHRDAATGDRLGPELNIREAWAVSTGQGAVVGIVDDGVDLAHTEFVGQGADELHFNFTTGKANGKPVASNQGHGTIVAGLALARANNGRGIAGIAHGARLASLVVWDSSDQFGTEEAVADMFQFRNNEIAVQNHSWGNSTIQQLEVPLVEANAIDDAIDNGRDGRGVVMIRVSGNNREEDWSAADDGYSNDPRVVTVGAVAPDGRVAEFSNAGAAVLCAGLMGSTAGDHPVYTTDRMGALGWNRDSDVDDPEIGSYHVIARGGNSFTAPQIAGVAALLIGANPKLTYRDVQQVLLHSSRHFDFDDPFLSTNAAGYRFTPNTGFGVPDAGLAVRLAKGWKTAAPLVIKTYRQTALTELPDDGLQLRLSVNGNETVFAASPGNGLVADEPTAAVPLVDVGRATELIEDDLTGRAALIERGGAFFSEKARHAAEAGAAFAVLYNHRNGDERFILGGMDFAAIPAVFLSQNDGAKVRELLASSREEPLKAALSLNDVNVKVAVPDSVRCEQVGVRVEMTHRVRSDIRLTVQSPTGTRSVLQANVPDGSGWRSDWTFWSNQFFYEPAKGDWTVAVSDLSKNFTGVLSAVELTVRGTALDDSDNDGLDDNWETEQFGSLGQAALGDPDGDGASNAREQALQTDPKAFDGRLDLSFLRLADGTLRLAWPSWHGFVYRVQSAEHALGPWSEQAVVGPGKFQTEWQAKPSSEGVRFYRVHAQPRP